MAEKTKARGVRIDDELWQDSKDEAAARGESVTDEIRRDLRRYTAKRRAARHAAELAASPVVAAS